MRLCSPEQPYPGLRPFEPPEAEYFCGRKREIRRLKGMIQEKRFVAVLGSSGAGKSSLVLAGVLPRLAGERFSTGEPSWQVLRTRPGGAPFRALADEAAELAHRLHPEQAVGGTAIRDRAMGLLRRGSHGLQHVTAELGLASGVRLLLIIDQFEELFRYRGIDQHQARREDEETRDRGDEAAAFTAALLAAHEGEAPPVHVVITMRSDFVGEAARFLGLPEAIDAGQFLVPRMSRSQMEAAVREPLELAGVTISSAFVQRLLNDTGTEPDALPVMQHALLRTWEEAAAEVTASAPGQHHGEMPAAHISGRKLLSRHYEAAGTMAQALSQHANAILDKLGEENRELPEVARWLFRALAEVDREGRAVRRPQRYAELVALLGRRRRKQVRRVIDRFRADDCHFLTPPVSAFPELKADTVIDITHEALLRNWDKVSGDFGKTGWLAQEFEDGLIWRGLAVEAELFAKDANYTLRAVTAKRHEKWLAGLPSPYWTKRHSISTADAAAGGPKQHEYPHEWHQVSRLISASSEEVERARQQQEIEEQRQRALEQWRIARRFRRITLAVTVLALLSMLFGGWAGYSYRGAMIQRARVLAMRADMATDSGDSRQAMLLALEALPEGPGPVEWLRRPILPEAVRALERALFRPFGRTLDAHGDRLVRVAYSPDGKAILTASEDRTVRVWDADGAIGTPKLKLQHASPVGSARFSRDGRFIVSAGHDGWASLWRASDGTKLSEWQLSVGRPTFVDLSADNRLIAAVAYGDAAGLWSWDPDATAEDGRSVKPPEKIGELVDGDGVTHPEGTNFVTFDAAGERVATTSWGGTARVWTARGRRLVRTLPGATGDHQGRCPEERQGHCGPITFAAFSGANPDLLVTASHDRTARIWDLAGGKVIRSLVGHERPVTDAAFIGAGSRVLTAGLDGTARIWDTQSGEMLQVLQGPALVAGTEATASLSPDEETMVASFANPSAYVWVARRDLQPFVLPRLSDAVPSAALSPDNRLLVAATGISVGLYDAETGRSLASPLYLDAAAMSVAISPDGNDMLLAAGDRADVFRLGGWNGEGTPPRLRQLGGHRDLVLSAVYSPDGERIVTASQDGTAMLWDARTGRRTEEPLHHREAVSSAVFDREGRRVLTASQDGTVRVWLAEGGALLRLIEVGSPALEAMFTADGRHVVVTTLDAPAEPLPQPPYFRTSTTIWDAETGQRIGDGNTEALQNVKFLQLANRVVVGTADGQVRLSGEFGNEPIAVLSGHRDSIARIVTSPGGQGMATISADGVVRVWKLPPADLYGLVGYANGIAEQHLAPEHRHLSEPEREALGLGDRPLPFREWLGLILRSMMPV